MNPEQQQIAIAEACGWKWYASPRGYQDRVCFLSDTPMKPPFIEGKDECPVAFDRRWNTLPDYLNDLNAMHAAITTWVEEAQSPYEKSEREHRFADELNKVILGKKNGYVRSGYITSAEEQAEAFLLVIGKLAEQHQDEDQDPRCPQCDGTGEGCADGVACSTCGGRGY